MSVLLGAHVAVFAVTALVCFGSIPRARTIQHPDTRLGFIGLLGSVGLWSLGYVGYLIAPTIHGKLASYITGFVFAFVAVGAWLYFCAAYTGRTPRHAPHKRVLLGLFLGIILLKITNPLHHLYFTTNWVQEPFPHLAIQHGIFHWVLLGLSYAAIAVGFFLLLERFYHTGTDARPLIILLSLTAIPGVATIFSPSIPGLLPLMYEPPGVALFAVGTLFVYLQRFESIRLTGESSEPAIFLDQDDCIRDYNQAAARIFPAIQGAIGTPIQEVVPELPRGDSDTDTFELDAGGAHGIYELTTAPFTEGGVVTGRLLTVSDVTDRERYREALEQKTEQLAALNRMVRHDIRNDMAVIIGWAEQLQEHIDPAGQDALDRVLRKSNHVIELTTLARDFVDSLGGEGTPSLYAVNLQETLESELAAVRDSYPDAHFRVRDELPAVTVHANELLGSVFRNLFTNAVVHNDEDTPIITVSGTVQNGRVQIRIADNGPGITDAQKDRLFKMGAKGPESTGTGMGLYLVHTLTTQYGGTVWTEPNEPKGTIFVVELPLDKPPNNPTNDRS